MKKPAKATLDACEALWAALSVAEGEDPAALRAQGWRSPTIECGGGDSAKARRMAEQCKRAGFEKREFLIFLHGRLRGVAFYRPKV